MRVTSGIKSRAVVAALSTLLCVTGLAAATGPAAATSASLSYDCTNPILGPFVATGVIDTDAPASLPSGQSVAITTTATVTLPPSVGDALRFVGATKVSGTATATGTVDGVARQSTLQIPQTDVPAAPGSPQILIGSGPSGTITAGSAGTSMLLAAGDFSIVITGYNSSGPLSATATLTCTLQGAQNLLIDTVAVVSAPTTTTVTATSPVEFGDTVTVNADVSKTGSNPKPAGKVDFTVDGATVTADVNGGKAKATLPAALVGVRQVTAVFTPTDTNLATSQAAAAFTVVKAGTTSSTSAVYRPGSDRIVARGKIVSAHATPVDGVVKYILKRGGVKIRTKTVTLNKFDVARGVFKNIRKTATYTVIARYKGSPTLKRSSDKFKFAIVA